MKKSDALKKAIEKRKEANDSEFEHRVEQFVWAIEKKSQELRDLKKELTDLTYEEVVVPDVSDCIED